MESINKPYDEVFLLIQRYMILDLYLKLGSKQIDCFKSVYQLIKHMVEEDLTQDYDEAYLCSSFAYYLDQCNTGLSKCDKNVF
jgi:hypothetical protein